MVDKGDVGTVRPAGRDDGTVRYGVAVGRGKRGASLR